LGGEKSIDKKVEGIKLEQV